MGDIDNSSSFLCEAHFDMIFQAHAIELRREIALKTHWWLAGDYRVAVRIFEGKKKENTWQDTSTVSQNPKFFQILRKVGNKLDVGEDVGFIVFYLYYYFWDHFYNKGLQVMSVYS